MKRFHIPGFALFATALAVLSMPRPAWAYLDPGTGSYILQMLIAALFGVLFTVKVFWTKIKNFFGSLFSPKSKHE